MSCELLESPVWDVVASKPAMFDVPDSAPVRDVLALLGEKNVLSVPVVGEPGAWMGAGGAPLRSASNGKNYIGVVSVIDLVAFVFEQINLGAAGVSPQEGTGASAEQRSVDPVACIRAALGRPVIEALGSTQESLSLWIESADLQLQFALQQFCGGGVHRALVLPPWFLPGFEPDDAGATGPRFLTQTDVVHFLAEHRARSATVLRLFDTSLRDLEFFASLSQKREASQKREVSSVPVEASADVQASSPTSKPPPRKEKVVRCAVVTASLTSVLREMAEATVLGVAVVDWDGKLVSVLSLADFRGVVAAMVPSLLEITVGDFLSQRYFGRQPSADLPEPLWCTRDIKLGDLVALILARQSHCAFVVDEKHRPVDVVTFTDIIKCVCKACSVE